MGIAIGTVLSGLVKPFTDLYQNRQNRIAQESKSAAKMDEIYANAAANDAGAAAAIAMVKTKNENNTWKDEYALIVITAPYVTAMILVLFGFDDATATIESMFAAMAAVPEYWQETFQVAIWSALGITGMKKLFKS